MSVTVFVLDLPEFSALVSSARDAGGCAIRLMESGYWKIEAANELRFSRKELGLGPALWNCALSGGFRGRIAAFDRNDIRLVCDEEEPS